MSKPIPDWMKPHDAATILNKAGLTDTKWGQRILSAERRGGFTADDARASCLWGTCAVNDADPDRILPRNHLKAPLDETLASLGEGLTTAVSEDDYIKAARVVARIHKHASKAILAVRSEVSNG